MPLSDGLSVFYLSQIVSFVFGQMVLKTKMSFTRTQTHVFAPVILTWPAELDIQTWPEDFEDVPAYQPSTFYIKALNS